MDCVTTGNLVIHWWRKPSGAAAEGPSHEVLASDSDFNHVWPVSPLASSVISTLFWPSLALVGVLWLPACSLSGATARARCPVTVTNSRCARSFAFQLLWLPAFSNNQLSLCLPIIISPLVIISLPVGISFSLRVEACEALFHPRQVHDCLPHGIP